MGIPVRKTDGHYTYRDYRQWSDGERWELIDGVAWNMSPAPARLHQEISGRLFYTIYGCLEHKECQVYAAPFDVLLPGLDERDEDDVSSVVQPDISVICDMNKLTDNGCTGAPDWIIEVLSPHTARKDIDVKFHLYERHGVREYWIVDPGDRYVHVYLLDENEKFPEEPDIFMSGDRIICAVVGGLVVEPDQLFGK